MITLTTNININSEYGLMIYILKYMDSLDYLDKLNITLCNRNGDTSLDFKINLSEEYDIKSLMRYKSYWTDFDDALKITNNFLPDNINISKVQIYFPLFSVDTYEKDTQYALTLNTWINGKCIYLGSYLINRLDSLAIAPVKRILGNNYYEYIEVPIIDPRDIMYADNWKDFRKNICGEPDNINNTGAIITVNLSPVLKLNNIYIPADKYTGAQGAINIFNYNYTNYLNVKLEFNEDNILFILKIIYNNKFINLKEYLYETYNLDETNISEVLHILLIIDKNGLIKKEIVKPYRYIDFIKSDEEYIFEINKLLYNNFNEWEPGLFIRSMFGIIYVINNETMSQAYQSNKIPFTKDIMKYLIKDDNIKHINLDNVDMNIYNINAVNKIENKIIQMDTPEDSKYNISYPIFYRVQNLQDIIIHPEVTENICINLDPYKSMNKRFSIQIEKVTFKEIGRTYAGVIFEIIGNQLPKLVSSGLFYIKNENDVLVTNGNYKYIM